MASTKRVRAFCWTLNNYTPVEVQALQNVPCKYVVWGEEKGENGTPHLQGYIELANASTIDSMKRLLGTRTHIEHRIGTPKQASNYCLKGEQTHAEWLEQHENGPNFGKNYVGYTRGVLSQQGKRVDLDEIGSAIFAGSSVEEISREHPGAFIQYGRGIERLKALQYKDRVARPKCVWRWGLAGTGKSYGPMHAHASYYIKDGTKWWDGYEQQEAIVIDDFDKDSWSFRDFLRLLDENPYSGEFKGGYIKINSPFIYVTCEHPPELLWTGNELTQVERRFAEIIEVVGEPGRATHTPIRKREIRAESKE